MDKVFAGLIGALVCLGAIAFVAQGEDRVIAEKCDYAGKVKLNDRVYTCALAAPTKGDGHD